MESLTVYLSVIWSYFDYQAGINYNKSNHEGSHIKYPLLVSPYNIFLLKKVTKIPIGLTIYVSKCSP